MKPRSSNRIRFNKLFIFKSDESRKSNIPSLLLTCITTAIAVLVFAFNQIDSRINMRLNDPNFIKSLSDELRPFLIFDQNGIITYNHGAEKFIVKIETNFQKDFYWDIDKAGLPHIRPDIIIIQANRFLQNAPLLENIGFINYKIESKRIQNNSWKYTLSATNPPLEHPEGKRPKGEFKLEILK